MVIVRKFQLGLCLPAGIILDRDRLQDYSALMSARNAGIYSKHIRRDMFQSEWGKLERPRRSCLRRKK